MSRVGSCIDNGPTEGFWGIIKTEMYQMYEITDERFHCQTPCEVRQATLKTDTPLENPIPENKRIQKYKERWCA